MSSGEKQSDEPDEEVVWYALRSRQPIGPLSTEELLQLIERKVLGTFDSVRVDGTDVWTLIRDVAPLLTAAAATPEVAIAVAPESEQMIQQERSPRPAHQEPEPDSELHNTSEAAETILKRMQRQPGGHLGAHSATRHRSQILQILFGLPVLIISKLVDLGAALFQIRGAKTVAALLVASLIGWLIWRQVNPHLPVSPYVVQEEFRDLYERLQSIPVDDPSTVNALGQEITRSVTWWMPRLEQSASHRRAELHELQAAAKLFPTAFQEVTQPSQTDEPPDSPTMRKLAIHLANADRRIARLPELVEPPQNPFGDLFSNQAVIWSIGIIDVAIIGWLLRLFLRKPQQS